MTEREGANYPEKDLIDITGEIEAISTEDSSIGHIQGITTNHALAQIERSFQMREQVESKISLARIRAYLIRFSEQKILLREHLAKMEHSTSITIKEDIERIAKNSLSILREFLTESIGNEVKVRDIMASVRNMLMEDLSPAIVLSKLNSIENVLLKAELLRVQKEIQEQNEYLAIIDGKLHIDHVSGLPNRQAFIEDFYSLLLEQLNGKRIVSVLSLKLIDDPESPEKTRFLPDDMSLKSFKELILQVQNFLKPREKKKEETSSLPEIDIEMELIPKEESENDEDTDNIEISIDFSDFENGDTSSESNYKERIENNRRLTEEMLMIFSTIGTENVGFTDLMAQESFQYKDALEEWQKPFKDYRIYRYGSGDIMILLDGSINKNRDRIFELRNKIMEVTPLFEVNISVAAFSDTSIKSISQNFTSKGDLQVVQDSMDTVFSLLSMGQYYAERFGKEYVNIAVNNKLCVFNDSDDAQESSEENDGKFDPFKVALVPEAQFRRKCALNNTEMFLRVYDGVRSGKLRKRR